MNTYQPAHLDGRTIVILGVAGSGFCILASGYLSFDGQKLSLVGDVSEWPFEDAQAEGLMPVTADNQFLECRGFDFFTIAAAELQPTCLVRCPNRRDIRSKYEHE